MADVNGPSAWDIGGIVGGAVALLGALGGAFSFIINRADRKETALTTRLERRVAELEAKDDKRDKEVIALRLAFEIVAGVVRRTDPANPELARAERILEAAFPPDLQTPTDMLAMLNKLSGN